MRKKYAIYYLMILVMLSSCDRLDDFVGNPVSKASNLKFKRIATFSNGSGDEGFAEISAYDAKTGRLFIVNPVESEISVWNISTPSISKKEASITDFGTIVGTPNSVAVHNGVLAVAIENEDKQVFGTINVYDTETLSLQNSYLAGALPDMVTFSPDGKYIISANEGEPNDDYTIDPEGSVTIVDLAANRAETLLFASFNGQNIGNDFRVFGPNATLAQDVEPEYVAVSDDSKTAYVSLQENNGLAVVDLQAMTIANVIGLGTKDYSLPENAIDASDRDDIAGNFKNWPVRGFYQPDAIAFAKIDGTGYIISANEGDARDYGGYSEEERVKDLNLDTAIFPNAAYLQIDENLGRLKTTTANGDTDNDGDLDQIYAYGGRSFTIWSTDGNVIYDSGNDIGKRTLEISPSLFNNDERETDGRSDDKGAEPEGVTTLQIDGSTLLFVGLERTGGAMVYDISNPTAPEFIDWIFNMSDVGPEGILAIPESDSPTGKNLLVLTHEVSNTISIYEIE
jgi:hypothetical protein